MGNKRIPFEPDKLYHVYNHGNGSESIFRSDENYIYFLKKYAHYLYPVVETFAYCLMPNHFHFLIRIRSVEELEEFAKSKNPPGFENLAGLVSRQFSHLFNAYAKALNKQYNR